MSIELLSTVDWNEWRKISPTLPPSQSNQPVQPQLAHAVVINGKAHEISEVERVALLVLSLGKSRKPETKTEAKQINKAIRCALREIEQSVLSCEQEIDYL